MSHRIFDYASIAIRKNKVTLTLNKPAYIWMWLLELSKVLMCKFHYDYIKNKYGKTYIRPILDYYLNTLVV